jgi:hypothetical protein
MKNTKLNSFVVISVLVLLSLFFVNFINLIEFTEPTRAFYSPGSNNPFLYGAIQTISDDPYYYKYDSLGFNFWHAYVGCVWDSNLQRHVPYGWASNNDSLTTPVSEYANALTGIYNNVKNHGQSNFLLQRPKIEWLAYGQSSKYQAENVAMSDPLWFYSFQSPNHVGTDIPDSGVTVRFCQGNPTNPELVRGIVVNGLKANTEQCKSSYGGTSEINNYQADAECWWYVKPRIRIPASFVQGHEETDICTIHIINQYERDTIPPVTIKAKHFHQFGNPNQYDGRYLEEFYFAQTLNEIPTGIPFHGALGNKSGWWSRGNIPEEQLQFDRHADFTVFWSGNCDMWLDYVKVENDVAQDLFRGIRDNWIHDELSVANNAGVKGKFYIELAEYNSLPCISYINQVCHSVAGNNIDLVTVFWPGIYSSVTNWDDMHTITTPQWTSDNYVKPGHFTMFYAQCYPFTTRYYDPPNPLLTFSRIPPTLPSTSCGNNPCGILALPSSTPGEYDTWLQDNLNHSPYWIESWGVPITYRYDGCWPMESIQDEGLFRFVMKMGDYASRQNNIPFVYMPQVHQWYYPEENLREPTNEELNLLANVSVAYGARGLMWWWFPSFEPDNNGCIKKGIGIMDEFPNNNRLRRENVYHETRYKWWTIDSIGIRMKKWEPYLMSFDNTNRHSYIYYIESERNELSNISNSYIHALRTFKPGYEQLDCTGDNLNLQNPSGMIYDCPDSTYLQVAKFSTSDPFTKYFMVVNRRCSPFYPVNDPHYPQGEQGGKRDVRIVFYQDHSAFNGYQTWKITDVAVQGYDPIYFDKSVYALLDLGDFLPGEGKLYKIEPVMKKGGILQANEVISGVEFTCEDTVFNNGHNITLGSNTTVHFTDTSTMVMNGGTFQTGDSSYHGSPNVTANAVSGSWHGLSFTNCTVKIYNTTFSNIKNDTSYALNIIDCHTVDIRNSVFNTEGGDIKGGINFTYYYQSGMPPNAYIGGNTFNWDKSKVPAINIMSDAGTIMPVIIENNTLNSSSTTGSTAIMLSGISGGAVKSNYINNFEKSITALSSSIDIAENTISSDINGSIGINTGSGTEIRLNNVGVEILGGMNNISNTDSSSINIKVDNSYFLIDNGQNIFNLGESQSSYHLKGYFPSGYSYGLQETQNCFKVNNAVYEPPIDSITIGEGGDQPSFNFEPYLTGCTMGDFGQQMIVNLGDGIYDTIDTRNGGGGEPNIFILTPKTLYDSISVQMRYRNYNYVKSKCTELINTYPDSIQSLNSISKLYLATTATDTTQTGMSALKTFYENLILNHTYNTALVKRCNYFVQKCKVKLRQYSSALAGFQQIINENPYSFEGLVAKWDYMATNLLDSLGQGGGEAPPDLPEGEGNNDPHDKFTKEQRQVIKQAINTSLEDSRKSDEQKIAGLTQLAKSGNVDAAVKLKVMKTLKEVIKTQAPKNIIEHIKIVNNDIQKVFGNPSSKSKSKVSNIPTVFNLSQNYPNPFNPTTKINFDLPKDLKVKIMVYEVLGREVIKLVDEFRRAGRYTVEFNGNNYASGVYFYRITAGEFILAKKMVLIK